MQFGSILLFNINYTILVTKVNYIVFVYIAYAVVLKNTTYIGLCSHTN